MITPAPRNSVFHLVGSLSLLSLLSFALLPVCAFLLVQIMALRQLKSPGQGNSDGPPRKAFEQLCSLRDTGNNCPQFSQQQWFRTSQEPIRVLSCQSMYNKTVSTCLLSNQGMGKDSLLFIFLCSITRLYLSTFSCRGCLCLQPVTCYISVPTRSPAAAVFLCPASTLHLGTACLSVSCNLMRPQGYLLSSLCSLGSFSPAFSTRKNLLKISSLCIKIRL